ncbi:phospholipase-like protein [Tanacetum coccineum]
MAYSSSSLSEQDTSSSLETFLALSLLLQDSISLWYADGTRYKVAWSDVDKVFMPINETDEQWCLVQLDIQTRVVTFYDSGVTYEPEWQEWLLFVKHIRHICSLAHVVTLNFPLKTLSYDNIMAMGLVQTCAHLMSSWQWDFKARSNVTMRENRLLCAWLLEVDGHSVTAFRMIVCVPTPHSAKLLGFSSDEEPIIEVDDIGYQMDTSLQVYNPTHGEF